MNRIADTRACWCAACLLICLGCAASRSQRDALPAPREAEVPRAAAPSASIAAVRQASFEQSGAPVRQLLAEPEAVEVPEVLPGESLADLESLAVANNPTLRRLRHEAAATWARSRYISKLPDPSVSSMFYAPPMDFVPDRQIAEMQLTQMIPWLHRLQAEGRRAQLEAMAAENEYRAERLRVVGDLRAAWYQLYVLGKQTAIASSDQNQIQSLINTANARIRTGGAEPGDVLMASLEASKVQEQLLDYRRQIAASIAEVNRLVGRDVNTPISLPVQIEVELPDWNYELLRELARRGQPELNAARMRTAATRWGIDVAALRRRPDLSFGVGWVVMDAPGATMPGAGRDSVTLGVSATLPIWHRKYDAMVAEASRQHSAAHASEDEISLQLDALLRDLWEQARTNHQTVALYRDSILPQARQTYEADLKSLMNNVVPFERVVRDYRTLLNFELGYHQALGRSAIAHARIRQAVGADLLAQPVRHR